MSDLAPDTSTDINSPSSFYSPNYFYMEGQPNWQGVSIDWEQFLQLSEGLFDNKCILPILDSNKESVGW